MAGKINKGKVIVAAQKYVQKGQYDKAIREYSKIVEEDPRDVRIWLKIGDLYAKKNQNEQAVDTYLKVAEFYSEQGFYLKAVAVFKQILKLNPALVDVNLKLAELYKQLGLLNDAMQQYELVSNYFHQAGRTKDALAALRQIVDLDPENVASRIKLAELYSKEQMRAEAVEEFAKAADFLRASSRLDDFIKVAERLIYHQPENLPITKELADLYLKRQDPRRALQKLQIAFKADARADDTLEMLAQAFRDLGQVQKTVSVWKELAQIHAENGQVAKQQELLRRILELAPHDEEVKKALAGTPVGRPPAPTGAAKPPPPPPPSRGPELFAEQDAYAAAAAAAAVPSRTGPTHAPPPPPRVATPAPAHFEAPRYGEGSGAYGDESYGTPQAAGFQQPYEEPEVDYYEAPEPYAVDDLGYEAAAPEAYGAGEAYDDGYAAYDDDGYAAPVAAAPGQESLPDEVARVLTESDVYIKYGLHDKAADHLRQVFVRDPNNVEVRLRLRDLQVQLGRYSEASLELYALARHTAERDVRAAAQYLNEALELDPQNAAARQLLSQIEGPPATPAPAYSGRGYSEDTLAEGIDELAAIDLDADDIVEEIPIDSADLLDQDSYGSPSMPSYAQTYGVGNSGVIEVHGETTDTLGQGMPAAEVISLPANGSNISESQRRMQAEEEAGTSLEDDLEEADFFIQQNLFAEARAILTELLERYPRHPLVEAKLGDLEMMEGEQTPLNMMETDRGTDVISDLASELAQSFDDIVADDRSLNSGPIAATYSVEDVFDDIKHSVESQVSDEDSDTHYDLGIAYREMGLLDDAIAEFKVAMRSREKEVLCHMMIGLCYAEKGMLSESISQFKTGLYVDGITERETIALYFELGQAYERLDDLREALYYYEKVAKKDPRFRDVERHVDRLRRATGETGERGNGSPGGGDDLDRALEDNRALSDETDVAKPF